MPPEDATEAEVDQQIEQLLSYHTTYEDDESGRACVEGDIVSCDIENKEGAETLAGKNRTMSLSSVGLPQELVVLQGGASVPGALGLGGLALRAELMSGSVAVVDQRAKARMQGYEGDPCGECGNFTLVRNGTCLKCNTCGGTTGCS